MKLTRLRLVGFKSFVEPAEVVIGQGLTGVVGPNGCGKSNLTEALRWVMGESSHKALRASGMDEVIFAGTAGRPARNTAEVILSIDNRAGLAPPPFAGHDEIEVSRRIERDKGSVYRVNGREARAREVQLLFADASTGARSAALVGQGKIGEIINAKPQARRSVLEEAAGISGLHARRHEAELKLRAAEQNLDRVEDVASALQVQIDALKRQARQAVRYRHLSGEIRRLESETAARAHAEAVRDAAAAALAAAEAERTVAARTADELSAARDQGLAEQALPKLREAAAAAAAALERLRREGQELDREEQAARERLAELAQRATQLGGDIAREEALAADAAGSLQALDEEAAALMAADQASAAAEAEAVQRRTARTAALEDADGALGLATAALAEHMAERTALGRRRDELAVRCRRMADARDTLSREMAELRAEIAGAGDLGALQAAADGAAAALAVADETVAAAEVQAGAAREAATAAQGPAGDARAALRQLEVERDTLIKLLRPAAGAAVPVSAGLRVARGYEAALAAALSEDLEAPDDPAAPLHWRTLDGAADDRALPAGAMPLAAEVSAPAALARRLAQIGVVERSAGPALQATLKPGQRLVSREGDLWRWDGYTALATAETAAARRLAERSRLADIEDALEPARRQAAERSAEADAAQAEAGRGAEAERAARESLRAARGAADKARGELAEAERRAERHTARLAGLEAQGVALAIDSEDAHAALAGLDAELAALPPADDLGAAKADAEDVARAARMALADARAAVDTLARERAARTDRRETLQHDRAAWIARRDGAAARVADLARRREDTAAEQTVLADVPAVIAGRRERLLGLLGEAETAAGGAGDALAEAERAKAAVDTTARAAREALTAAREQLAREEARREAAEQRVGEAAERLAEVGGAVMSAEALAAAAGSADKLAEDLERLKRDRERLGGVNLRAEDELAEVETNHERLVAEREDLVAAIRDLRQGIQTLNREGRDRLASAFATVDGHFRRLFTTLFGGGEARLELVDAEDPLEAGLEVMVCPPGKRVQALSLLSGGEQALAAMALIFAIFLTNPAPICVLDEVDAPLDDANVERLCNLLQAMCEDTDTRFIVVTHNPVTMSRMDRLFGVTMAERGVSQLVSVDLETAERMRDAG